MPLFSPLSQSVARIAGQTIDGTSKRPYSYRPSVGAWRSLASALQWGCRGRRFESSRPDHFFACYVMGDVRSPQRELVANKGDDPFGCHGAPFREHGP